MWRTRSGFAPSDALSIGHRDVWWLSDRAVDHSARLLRCRLAAPRYTGAMGANTVTALMHLHAGARIDQVLARSQPHLDWLHWLA